MNLLQIKSDGLKSKTILSTLTGLLTCLVVNRRCKGQQHMRWSREGLNPLLQIRAALNSKGEWESKWKTAILNAA